MATKKAQPKSAPRNVPTPVSPTNWDDVLGSLATAGTGPHFFIKSTRTRMRLACLEEDERNFFAEATTVFKGREKTKYVVFAQILSTEGGKGPLDDRWKNKLVPVVLSKTALQGVIALLAEGYDLFSEKAGYGITVLKSGTGTDTDYNVNPSPQPVPLNLNALEMPEKTLRDYAEDLTNRSQARNGTDSGAATDSW